MYWILRFRLWLRLAAIGATGLLVYASIVPLRYTPLSWAETMRRWQEVPWLELGVYHRADWVANALVVIPSGFFATGAVWFSSHRRWVHWGGAALISLLLCGLVYAIEFVQLWFPPRTVSQNDLFAGCVGAVIGPLAWFAAGPLTARMLVGFLTIPTIRGRLRVLSLFGVGAAVLYSVLPLDLVVNGQELARKWESGRIVLVPSPSDLGDLVVLQGAVLAAIRMLPVGLWFGLDRRPWGSSVPAMVTVAVMMELVQVPIYSKYASTTEVAWGILGGFIGWWLGQGPRPLVRLVARPWPWAVVMAAFLVAAPVALLGRYEAVITDAERLGQRWDGFWTPPLLRYYYSSEYDAVSNLAGKLGMFACFGVAVAGWSWSVRMAERWWPFLAGLGVVILWGAAIEIAQVYLKPLIADATDVAIYALGFGLGHAASRLTLREP